VLLPNPQFSAARVQVLEKGKNAKIPDFSKEETDWKPILLPTSFDALWIE
jgi:hypothetical protein